MSTLFHNSSYLHIFTISFCYMDVLLGVPWQALYTLWLVGRRISRGEKEMAMIPRPGGGLPPEFNTWVRHFVHYDTLTKSLQQQTTNARQLKDKYEDSIVGALQSHNMNNATIQISNGRLQLVSEKHPAPLNFQTLQALLNDYFKAKGGAHPNETENIMRYIRSHRKSVVTERLKRDLFVPPAPPSLE